MNLRQLEIFQAVMRTGSMSAAAPLVCITQSAVSKIIAHTELQLGYALFARTRTGLVPTHEARVLFQESAPIRSKLDDLRKVASNLRDVDSRQVRLAAIPAIAHELLPELLKRYALRHPNVNVEVRTLHQDQLPQALLTHGVDFALGYFEHPHPQLASRLLVSGPLHAAVARDVWQRATPARRADPMSFLAKLPIIRLVRDDPMSEVIDDFALRLGVSPTGIHVQTSRLALELVRLEMGWTVIDFLSAANVDARNVVMLELPALPATPLYAYHASAAPPGRHVLRMLDLLAPLLTQVTAAGTIRTGGECQRSAS
jgi:DNA-binding transcriptional LysR family regulator